MILTGKEKTVVQNWANYLCILRMNKWSITPDLLAEPLKQWKEHTGEEPSLVLEGVLAMILFPYVQSMGDR